jgi:hypothetical protein
MKTIVQDIKILVLFATVSIFAFYGKRVIESFDCWENYFSRPITWRFFVLVFALSVLIICFITKTPITYHIISIAIFLKQLQEYLCVKFFALKNKITKQNFRDIINLQQVHNMILSRYILLAGFFLLKWFIQVITVVYELSRYSFNLERHIYSVRMKFKNWYVMQKYWLFYGNFKLCVVVIIFLELIFKFYEKYLYKKFKR